MARERPRGRGADREDPDPPEGREPRLRRGGGPRLRTEPRPRRLPVEGRRPHVGEGPVHQPEDRRGGPRRWTSRTLASSTPRRGRAQRKPWTIVSGSAESGLYRTSDGGDHWTKLSGGLPQGVVGRIGVAVSPADPDRVWALVEAAEGGGLYRSDDGGGTWTRLETNARRRLYQRTWYYQHIVADPQDRNRVYVMNVDSFVSEDGGKSFEEIHDLPHGDAHDLWINPNDTAVMIHANDGGGTVSLDRGKTWSTELNQPTAEIYNAAVDGAFPYNVYGAQQDNTTIRLPSRAPKSLTPYEAWRDVGGCESGSIAVDPKDPDVVYAGCGYGGEITRRNLRTGQWRNVMAYAEMEVGQAPRDLKYRFNWNAPIRFSPHDPRVLYHCSQFVHRSTDEGQSWQRHLAGPLAQRQGQAELLRRADHLREHGRRDELEHPFVRGIARHRRRAVGRQRRRARARLARRREELGERHAAGTAGMGERRVARALADERRARDVRGGAPSDGRLPPDDLSDRGFRPDLEAADRRRERDSRRRARTGRARRPGAARSPLRRHGEGRLRLLRRRRALAADAAEPAARPGHGPPRARRRPRRLDAGSELLDPGRPDAAARGAARASDGPGAAAAAARRVSRGPGEPQAGEPARREPALRRGLLLLARRRSLRRKSGWRSRTPPGTRCRRSRARATRSPIRPRSS